MSTNKKTPSKIEAPQEDLKNSVDHLTLIIKKRTSLGYRLLSGLITGAATAVGATVIAGAAVYILSTFLQQIDLSSIPFLQDFIEASNLGE